VGWWLWTEVMQLLHLPAFSPSHLRPLSQPVLYAALLHASHDNQESLVVDDLLSAMLGIEGQCVPRVWLYPCPSATGC
jgi:hypothetical protein